ncbi:hypothetical protein VNO77_28899 [Canavalia gladiata]|uniref:Uncharacterized protein n=1 Tax=Canavalia gladiata TaxID=3824 RepID=A0AAN9Q7F0_CANGL
MGTQSCFCTDPELASHSIMSDVKSSLPFSFLTPFCPVKCDSCRSNSKSKLSLLAFSCCRYCSTPVGGIAAFRAFSMFVPPTSYPILLNVNQLHGLINQNYNPIAPNSLLSFLPLNSAGGMFYLQFFEKKLSCLGFRGGYSRIIGVWCPPFKPSAWFCFDNTLNHKDPAMASLFICGLKLYDEKNIPKFIPHHQLKTGYKNVSTFMNQTSELSLPHRQL